MPKNRIDEIAHILEKEGITDDDLKEMIRKLPNGRWDFFDIMNAYGIRYDPSLENA